MDILKELNFTNDEINTLIAGVKHLPIIPETPTGIIAEAFAELIMPSKNIDGLKKRADGYKKTAEAKMEMQRDDNILLQSKLVALKRYLNKMAEEEIATQTKAENEPKEKDAPEPVSNYTDDKD